MGGCVCNLKYQNSESNSSNIMTNSFFFHAHTLTICVLAVPECLHKTTLNMYTRQTRPRGYKTFSCSTQPSTKCQKLIKTKIHTNEEVSYFKSLKGRIYHANKC